MVKTDSSRVRKGYFCMSRFVSVFEVTHVVHKTCNMNRTTHTHTHTGRFFQTGHCTVRTHSINHVLFHSSVTVEYALIQLTMCSFIHRLLYSTHSFNQPCALSFIGYCTVRPHSINGIIALQGVKIITQSFGQIGPYSYRYSESRDDFQSIEAKTRSFCQQVKEWRTFKVYLPTDGVPYSQKMAQAQA